MATQSKSLVINRNWCKGCNICVAFCPQHVLELDTEDKAVAVRPDDCTFCKLCELRCPDLAISITTMPRLISDPASDESSRENVRHEYN